MHDFFLFNFPLRENIFCTSSAAPDKFSNGPSLRDRLGAASQSYRSCSEITFLCVNRRPFLYGFSAGSKAIRFRDCLPGGGRPQIGEVNYGGSLHLSSKRDQIKMRDYMDRRVTPPK